MTPLKCPQPLLTVLRRFSAFRWSRRTAAPPESNPCGLFRFAFQKMPLHVLLKFVTESTLLVILYHDFILLSRYPQRFFRVFFEITVEIPRKEEECKFQHRFRLSHTVAAARSANIDVFFSRKKHLTFFPFSVIIFSRRVAGMRKSGWTYLPLSLLSPIFIVLRNA